jgi:cobalt transporter subunit CbtA
MKLFQRIFFAAVLAGLLAGLAMAAVQQWKLVPLILEAEVFEAAAPGPHSHNAAAPAHEHEAEAWAPQDGAERIVYTVLADVLAAMGFALVLAAVSTLAGIGITARNGVLWGLGGFIAFQLAPAFGLAPELPGMPAADLVPRQVWWWGTALATAGAILTIARFRNWSAIGIAAVLILVPHIVGAPVAPDESSAVPARLAAEFAAISLAVGAMFWLIVGPLLGYFNERFTRGAVAAKGAHA